MREWVEKYVPHRKGRWICRKCGIDKDILWRWKTLQSQPSTIALIYLSLTISKEFGHDYNTVVLEGIKQAAKVRHDKIISKVHE